MKTLPFQTVLETILGLMGQRLDSTTGVQLDNLSNFVNLRVLEYYDYVPWPEIIKVEQRAFAEDWRDDADYAEDDVVWYPTTEKYYAALQDNSDVVPTDTDNWEETDTPSDRFIDFEQYNENKIGKVWYVGKNHPFSSTSLYDYEFKEGVDGLWVPNANVARVWLTFTPPAPRFTAIAHDVTVTYQRYDVVYYDSDDADDQFPDRGECYIAELDTDGNQVWNLVPFPEVIAQWVCYAAGADMLRYYGNKEVAGLWDARANQLRTQTWRKYQANFAAYPTRMNR